MHLRRSRLFGLFLLTVSSVFVSHGDSLPQVASQLLDGIEVAPVLFSCFGVMLAEEITFVPGRTLRVFGDEIAAQENEPRESCR
jgi:hypothetical protein